VNINHANALGITTSPPVRNGKISAASLMTHRGGISGRLKRERAAEARVTARPVDNIS
jgi:hypothetical protein